MPVLPRIEALGARPTPQPSSFVAGLSGQEGASGEALQRLGQATGNFGQTFDRIQDQNDRTRAEESYNRLLEKRLNLTQGENGFLSKRSGDAVKGDLINDYETQFNAAVEEEAKGLDSPRQQKYFSDRANIARLQYKQDLIRHTTAQQKVYSQEVYASTLDIERRNAIQRFLDPVAVETSKTRINGVISQRADSEGWPAEKTQQVKFEAISGVNVGLIQQAVNNNDSSMAKKLFDEHKENIDPELYDDIQRIIGVSSRSELIQAIGDDAETRGLRLDEAQAEIRKNYSGDEEKDLIAGIKARYRDTQVAAADNAWNVYIETGDINKIPAAVWDRLSGQEKDRLKSKDRASRTGGVPNGRGDYTSLRRLATEDFNAFKALDLNRYTLNDGNHKELVDLQTGEIKLATAQTQQQIMDEMLEFLGGNRKDRDSDASIEAYNQIKLELDHAQDEKGRALTKRQMQDVADSLRIQVTRDRARFSPLRIISETFEEPAGRAEIEGIPQEIITDMAQKLQEIGQPVTEDNIRKAYEHYYGGQ